MAQAESNRVSLHLSEETAWDETPSSPTMLGLPYTAETIGYEKRTIKSNLVRSDRLTDDIIEVGAGAQGDIQFEYKFADFELLMEGALGSDFTTVTTTGAGSSGNFDFAASSGGTQVITGPAAWTNNYQVNGWVKVSGAAAANNGYFKVTAKASTTLTVANASGTLQTSVAATVLQKMARTGTTKKSYLIEKSFNDLPQYIHFRGMRVSTWAMSIEAEQIVTGSFGFMGSRGVGQGTTISGSKTAASANSVCGATANVGTIQENGSALTTKIKALRFNLNANPRALPAVGNKFPVGINYGSFEITGTVEAYFEDLTLYNKFINHNDSSLMVDIVSPEGNHTIITINNLKFTNAQPVGAGLNQDVTVAMDFTAKRNATDDAMLQVDLLL